MLELRRAEPADVPFIAGLERKYIECPWSESMIKETLADPSCVIYLLCEDGAPVGYGGVRVVFETAELLNVAVDGAHRRKGYGSMIADGLMRHARERGAEEMLLEVNEHNAPAIALYALKGFKKLSERKNYYKSGNALVLRSEL